MVICYSTPNELRHEYRPIAQKLSSYFHCSCDNILLIPPNKSKAKKKNNLLCTNYALRIHDATFYFVVTQAPLSLCGSPFTAMCYLRAIFSFLSFSSKKYYSSLRYSMSMVPTAPWFS